MNFLYLLLNNYLTQIAEKSIAAAADTSTSESSSSSDEDTESSEQESRPASPAIHKPVPNQPTETCEETQDNSDASSEQLMSPGNMIPKTPGPPPGKKLDISDDDSDEEDTRPAQQPYRGKSQMNITSGRDTDTSDIQEDYGKMDICPKTPGAGLVLKQLQMHDDDDDDDVEANGMSDKASCLSCLTTSLGLKVN